MAETTCPFCHAALFESEVAAGECTSCMQKLPRRRSRDPLARTGRAASGPAAGESWQGVRGGVGLLCLAVFAEMVLAPLLLIGVWASKADSFGPANSRLTDLLLLFGLFGLVTAGVIGLIGLIMSLSAPAQSGFRSHAVGSGVLFLLSPLVIGAPILLAELWQGNRIYYRFELVLVVVFLMGIVLLFISVAWYSIFLRGVARHFRDDFLGVSFLTFAIVTPVLALLAFVGLLLLKTLHVSSSETEMFMLLGSVSASFFLFCWFGFLLNRLYRLVPALPWRRLPPEDE